MDFKKLLDDLMNGFINIESLANHKDEFMQYGNKILNTSRIEYSQLEAFIRLCLNYYVFSTNGDVLIPDAIYDMCMNTYMSNGNDRIVYSDSLNPNTNKWQIMKHEIPGLVGSLSKIYEYSELKDYYNNKMGKLTTYCLAPKYDGISVAIKIENGDMDYALTRYDGYEGFDISRVLRKADMSLVYKYKLDGYYKCEIVVSNDSFGKLVEEKKYSNRRSAVSGICSSPSNIHLGKYLTVLPLLYYDNSVVTYIAPHSKMVTHYHARDLMSELEILIEKYKKTEFPYRVDGVVIYPMLGHNRVNEADLMDDAVAYKINTSRAVTKLKYAYFSIGRLGNAVPMLKVEPVEVNETIVEDASLGSYNNFRSMNLHENEEVVVFSAGDTIPQVEPMEVRYNMYHEDPLKIDKHCPYCGEKLSRTTVEYRCANPDCIRVITGRIANFIDKLGVLGFADKTIEALYEAGYLKSISDLFELKYHKNELIKLDGFSNKSVDNIIEYIDELSETPITISKIFGALGIENISEKKARKIFDTISIKEVLDKKPKKIVDIILASDGIGYKTAQTFADFVDEYRDEIREILKHMRSVDNVTYRGSITFSGFRNPEWAKKFESIGIEVANNVTNRTIALVTTDQFRSTSNCKKAISKGISIFDYKDIEDLFERVKKL